MIDRISRPHNCLANFSCPIAPTALTPALPFPPACILCHPTTDHKPKAHLPTYAPTAPDCLACRRPPARSHAGKLVVDLRPFVIKVISSGASGEGIFGVLLHFRYRSRAPVCSLSRFNGKNQANRLYGKCPGFLKCSC